MVLMSGMSKRNNKVGFGKISTDLSSAKVKKYQALYGAAISQLLPSLNYYKFGDFESLNTEFTNKKYAEVAETLADGDRYSDARVEKITYKDATFNTIRNSFHGILDGLNRGRIQHLDEVDHLEQINEFQTILQDPEKLQEYYKAHYETYENKDLSVEVELSLAPAFKPEYGIYIERFGLPINGVFESEQLATILLELNR